MPQPAEAEALDIFFAWHGQLATSLPCDNLANLIFARRTLGASFSPLKVLSISITDPLVDDTKLDTQESDENEDDAAVSRLERRTPQASLSRDIIANEKNYSALSEMLQLCPSLEELNVVGHKLDCLDSELRNLQETMRCQHLRYLSIATPLPRLRKLRLKRMEVKDNGLLAFLGNHSSSLREIDLTMIWLPEGSFSSVISYITGMDTRLEAIRLDCIKQSH